MVGKKGRFLLRYWSYSFFSSSGSFVFLLCRFKLEDQLSTFAGEHQKVSEDNNKHVKFEDVKSEADQSAESSEADKDAGNPTGNEAHEPHVGEKKNGARHAAVLNTDFDCTQLFGVPHVRYHPKGKDWFPYIQHIMSCLFNGTVPVRPTTPATPAIASSEPRERLSPPNLSIKTEPVEDAGVKVEEAKAATVVEPVDMSPDDKELVALPMTPIEATNGAAEASDSSMDCGANDAHSDDSSSQSPEAMDVEDCEVSSLTAQERPVSIPVRRPSGSLLASLRSPEVGDRPSSTEATVTAEELTLGAASGLTPSPTPSGDCPVSPDTVEVKVSKAPRKAKAASRRGRPKKASPSWQEVFQKQVEKWTADMCAPESVSSL